MKERFSEEQVAATLREGQAGQIAVEHLCRRHGIAPPAYYGWGRRHGSMAEPDVRRLRELGEENARLERMPAERDLELDAVKESLQKKWRAWPAAARPPSSPGSPGRGRPRRPVPASRRG